ncbi:hypothetical protein SLE2022_299370 [Rubroshorea leprosula]
MSSFGVTLYVCNHPFSENNLRSGFSCLWMGHDSHEHCHFIMVGRIVGGGQYSIDLQEFMVALSLWFFFNEVSMTIGNKAGWSQLSSG